MKEIIKQQLFDASFNEMVLFVFFLGNVIKVAIVINSLSRLLLWKSSSMVCTLLNQLYSNPPDSQTGKCLS